MLQQTGQFIRTARFVALRGLIRSLCSSSKNTLKAAKAALTGNNYGTANHSCDDYDKQTGITRPKIAYSFIYTEKSFTGGLSDSPE